jgi:S-DNA-T family DNA segregation ATPase FtsK/SpoIIIE
MVELSGRIIEFMEEPEVVVVKKKPTVADKETKPVREKKTTKKVTEPESPVAKWWNDGRVSKISGLLLVLTSFVMATSFISYLFSVTTDQSEVLTRGASVLTDSSVVVNNALGRFGAWLSNLFINGLFGFSSFLLVALCFAIGFNLMVQKSVFPTLKITTYSITSLVWFSSLFAFLNYLIYPTSVVAWGGAFGDYLTGETGYFTSLISPVGTGALLLVSALIIMVALYNISFDFMLGKKKDSDVLNHQQTSNKTAPPFIPTEYKDTDENIFAKDKIADELAADVVPVSELTLEVNEDISADNNLLNEDEDLDGISLSGLELEVEETPDEPVSNMPQGGIGVNYDPTLDLSNYKFPSLDLLEEHGSDKVKIDAEELERNKNQIISTLNNYQIEISKIKATIGPTVTLYEIVPAPGVRISKIKNLEDDIALSLAALGIRIIAPIPGKGTIGIEVPNVNKEIVSMRSLLASDKFQNSTADLPICLGKSISNEIYVADLAKMPHLLMAGATGQGKSVGINSILVSLLYKKHPSQLKFILVDPKKVELSLYETLEKHFLAKLPGEEDAIITDTKKVVTTLNALCLEMDDRYNLLKKASCRNLKEYNHKFLNRQLNPQNGHKFLPYIVLVVDEFADLIMTAGKEVEMPIARLAQLARAIGIHLILATQRPSVNIITGTIKANFPARIAFKTTSKIDSRTILDQGGSEQLIGRGDMLLSSGSDMIRLQCGFVDTPEVEKVRDFIAAQQGYSTAFELPEYIDPNAKDSGDEFYVDGARDDLFEDAARVIVQNQMGSTSLIQRRLKLGYNRAGRLMDQLQEAGIVGDNLGTKSREVKFKTELELEQYLQKLREP